MEKRADAFRSIGEVAKMVGVAPHVLRYWETQFPQLKPMKRPDGRRYYRPDDVQLVAGLCEVLREEGLTIRGAKKLMARDRGESIRDRGAARLNGAALDSATEEAIPAVTGTSMQSALSQPVQSATEEPREMSSQPSRPRSRKRPAGDITQSLPLFPDLAASSAEGDGIWLSRLVGTAARLRRADRLTVAAYRQCKQLRDAISRHY
ncbi:MerR family transcriptional regulator [Paracoccus alkanivorans]|uniref:MerR family transcriptional regulator n=1 Tax=Paracoccus alkanivorans TaxID=2116655 RepID=A0A3M0MG54_9RHOB|nr:MerR family transcriptional regulator [Paracoccus alkanivorans]RMC36569.1 MerR family transcriptional regulator [Paracoccus alkanivorans]